jgi:hypothetical protein
MKHEYYICSYVYDEIMQNQNGIYICIYILNQISDGPKIMVY